MNKIKSYSPKDALCQVWLKLAQLFWRRRFFKFVNLFSLFLNYLLLEKDGALHLNKLESPSPKDALCQIWFKLAHSSWEEVVNRKSLQTDRQTDDGRKAIRKAHLSFQIWWAKKPLNWTNLYIKEEALRPYRSPEYQRLHLLHFRRTRICLSTAHHRINEKQQYHRKAAL